MANNKKGMLTPAIVAMIFGFIALVGNYIVTKMQENNDDLDKKEVLSKTQGVENKIDLTNDYLSANNSFCYAELLMSENSNKAEITIKHCGKYALSNLELSIVNTDYACFSIESTIADFDGYVETSSNNFGPYNVISEERKFVGGIKTVSKLEKHFNLRFTSNNKEWFQRIVLRENKPMLTYDWATQVYKMEDGKEVILTQGTDVVMDREFSVGKIITTMTSTGHTRRVVLSNLWDGFLLKEGEKTPWDKRCKVHYDGHIVISPFE
ncbi:hypothetical protein M0L20_29985 [Spirosoma sp. RP8]|uniref:Uncharacterized protein n=1 Tax=Spirosoma liriopis TaxID=2937440 RepID=A0ABT0HVY2_9BACT|nr:hypothetical protein [Spirosoma liriopis]MCK8496135.1 hypothetical protein [Spirosoma liriopis]